jgi:hypothetical protein
MDKCHTQVSLSFSDFRKAAGILTLSAVKRESFGYIAAIQDSRREQDFHLCSSRLMSENVQPLLKCLFVVVTEYFSSLS